MTTSEAFGLDWNVHARLDYDDLLPSPISHCIDTSHYSFRLTCMYTAVPRHTNFSHQQLIWGTHHRRINSKPTLGNVPST